MPNSSENVLNWLYRYLIKCQYWSKFNNSNNDTINYDNDDDNDDDNEDYLSIVNAISGQYK